MNDDAPVCPRNLYLALRAGAPDTALRHTARRYLHTALATVRPASLPRDVPSLRRSLLGADHATGQRFQRYLAARQAGMSRRYFPRRAHALSFIRRSAPTKLVDGAWLHGVLPYWRDPRFHGLIHTYLEELGDGVPGRNHVRIYQHLLSSLACETGSELPARYYVQGALQLCLGWLADEFLPEIIGFNLGYEQLPLHLLVTTHELRELGIDARYFTLHISIDNADTGHAFLAAEAVRELLGQRPDDDSYRRLCLGYALNSVGVGAEDLVRECDLAQELAAVFQRKRATGRGLHAPHCRIAGEPVTAWLSDAARLPALLQALRRDNGARPGRPFAETRLGRLLDADTGAMAGVFSPYEQLLLADWLGVEPTPGLCEKQGAGSVSSPDDTAAGEQGRLPAIPGAAPAPDEARPDELLRWMSPAQHFTPAGLAATQQFCASWRN